MGILSKFRRVGAAYAALKAAGADPFGVRFDAIVSPTVGVVDGRPVLLLGTNNYLGLTFDPDCMAAAAEAARTSGTGTTGSRIANGTYAGHGDLEAAIARFYGRRSAMVFTTGYQANLGLLSTIADADDDVLIDADSHASIYDGVRMGAAPVTRFRHNDPEDLARRLRHLRHRPGHRLIVVEGIYSMLGDAARLREIAAVKREAGAVLLVDEAHSMGVLGARGRGLAEAAGVEADVDIVVGTFSKSLGAVGGFCVSDLPDFDLLRVACRPYMFTASLPPSVIASVRRALGAVEERPELRARLLRNAGRLYDGLAEAGFALGPEPSPIVAVRLPGREAAVAAWNALLARGIYVNLALPPATPGGASLLRASVSAAHAPADIDEALAAFRAVGLELGLLPAPLRAAAGR
jgi:8-amino-7-oxononanoate synthase